MHISKRDTISRGKAWTIRAIAILLALIVDGIIIYAIVKMNPLKVYVSLASGAFGTSKRMWFTIRDCMILTCIAIGLAPAFKMRFWNVGAEGQMLVGGIATAFWMINFAGKMNIVMLFLCMAISAIVAGGIWGLIPGFRPGKPTSDFILKVINKITLFGALYLAIVAILPIIAGIIIKNTSLAVGGTSVIIVVGVALETVKSLEAQMLMRHYKGFLE